MENIKQWRGYFKTEAVFKSKLSYGELDENAIYFIEDKGLIYTRGHYFSVDKTDLQLKLTTLQGRKIFSKLTDGTTTVASPSSEGTIRFNSGDYVNCTVGSDGITIGVDMQAIKDEVSSNLKVADALVFKGTLGIGGTATVLPTSELTVGDTYKVVEGGVYSGHKCEVGDMIICLNADLQEWVVVQGNIDNAATKQDIIDANSWLEYD